MIVGRSEMVLSAHPGDERNDPPTRGRLRELVEEKLTEAFEEAGDFTGGECHQWYEKVKPRYKKALKLLGLRGYALKNGYGSNDNWVDWLDVETPEGKCLKVPDLDDDERFREAHGTAKDAVPTEDSAAPIRKIVDFFMALLPPLVARPCTKCSGGGIMEPAGSEPHTCRLCLGHKLLWVVGVCCETPTFDLHDGKWYCTSCDTTIALPEEPKFYQFEAGQPRPMAVFDSLDAVFLAGPPPPGVMLVRGRIEWSSRVSTESLVATASRRRWKLTPLGKRLASKLSEDECAVLRHLQATNRNWKAALGIAWYKCDASDLARPGAVGENDNAILIGLRNRLGPQWLHRLRPADYGGSKRSR